MPEYTKAQKEQIARQNGFQSYEAMILFEQQKRRAREAQVQAQLKGSRELLPGAPMTFSDSIEQALGWHPARSLKMVGDKLKAAMPDW